MDKVIYIVYILFAAVVLYKSEENKIGIEQKEEYFRRINLFRGLFALDIIIGHVAGQNMIPLMPFEKFSIVSVAGFFFLSGSGMVNSYHVKERYLKKIPGKIAYLVGVTVFLYAIKLLVQYISGYDLGYIPSNILKMPIVYFEKTNWYIWELVLLYIVFMFVYKIADSRIVRVCLVFLCTLLVGGYFALNDYIVAWYYSILGFAFGVLFAEYFETILKCIHRWYGVLITSVFCGLGVYGYIAFSDSVIASYITRNLFCIACIIIMILLVEQFKIENLVIKSLTIFSLELFLYQSIWLDITQHLQEKYMLRMLLVVGGTYITAIIIRPVNKKIKLLCSKIDEFM